jgi:hypothetical protein
MTRRATALAIVAGALAATTAHADDRARAEKLYDEGARAHARGDERAAAALFEASYDLAKHGATIYNAAVSWLAAGEASLAADDYLDALADADLEGPSRATAKARLAALERALGRLVLAAPSAASPPRASIDGARAHVVPATVHAGPGEHSILVTYAGGVTRTVVVHVSAGAETPVDVGPVVQAPEPQPARTPASSLSSTLGWIGMGTGIAVIGTGFVVGAVGLHANSSFDASGDSDAGLRSSAVDLRSWANVLIVTGCVLGVTGLVVALTAPRAGQQRGAAWLRVGPSTVSAGGSF